MTFALGTAAGDLASEALSLRFCNGALIFGAMIVVTFLAARAGASRVLTFWIAYILTRPLGASLGDLLTQDRAFGGLGLGASLTSVVFFVVIVVLVARAQMLANRHGVAAKGDVHDPQAGAAVTVTGSATVQVHPTTALGDMSPSTASDTDPAPQGRGIDHREDLAGAQHQPDRFDLRHGGAVVRFRSSNGGTGPRRR